MCEAVAPGVTTWDLDQIARSEIKKRQVKSEVADVIRRGHTLGIQVHQSSNDSERGFTKNGFV